LRGTGEQLRLQAFPAARTPGRTDDLGDSATRNPTDCRVDGTYTGWRRLHLNWRPSRKCGRDAISEACFYLCADESRGGHSGDKEERQMFVFCSPITLALKSLWCQLEQYGKKAKLLKK
jgi:hypothetical protein